MPNMSDQSHAMVPVCAVAAKLAATAQTGLEEVITGLRPIDREAEPFPKIPYHQFSRLIDVCCIANILREFPMSSLRGDEIDRFLELQSFFIRLESRCLDEAGFE